MQHRSLFSRWPCLALWLIFGGVFLWSLPGRMPLLDDAWLGEQAYWLQRDGVVHSRLFTSFEDWGTRIWVFHKLFIPQGALAIGLLGWSLPALQAVSLPWFALVLVLLAWRARRLPGNNGTTTALLVPLLLFAHPLAITHAYSFRPELCLAALGLSSYLLLENGLRNNSRITLLASAIVAGLAALVHLNGLLFIAAGCLTLLASREVSRALQFLFVALFIASLYLADALSSGELANLWAQLRSDPALDARDFTVGGALERLLREPRRWIRHGEDVTTTALVILAVAVARGRLWREHRQLAVYTGSALLGLALLAQSTTAKYMLPVLPMLLLVVGVALQEVEGWSPRRRGCAIGFLLLALGVLGSRSLRYFSHRVDIQERHAASLDEQIEAGSRVLADLTFIFDQLESHDVRGLWAYRIESESGGAPLEIEWLLRRAREDRVPFVVLDSLHELPKKLAGEWLSQDRMDTGWDTRQLDLSPPVLLLSDSRQQASRPAVGLNSGPSGAAPRHR